MFGPKKRRLSANSAFLFQERVCRRTCSERHNDKETDFVKINESWSQKKQEKGEKEETTRTEQF